jgi:hypothetical protein
MTPTRNSQGSRDRDLHSTRRAFLFAREQIAAHAMGFAARDGDPAGHRQRSARSATGAPDPSAG